MGLLETIQQENQELRSAVSQMRQELDLIRYSFRHIGWVHWQDAARMTGISKHETIKKKGMLGELETRIRPDTTTILEVSLQSICEYLSSKKNLTIEAIGERIAA